MSIEMVTAIAAALVLIITAIGKILVDLQKIHSLVNSRLTEALDEIAQLRTYISKVIETSDVGAEIAPVTAGPPIDEEAKT